MPIPMGNWPIRRRRQLLPSNSSVTAPSLRPWALPSNQGSRSIHPSRRGRTSRPTVCSLVTSLVFVCCSGMRICRFWLPPTTWPVLCRFPRLLRMRRNIRLVPRRVFLKRLFRDLVLTPSLLDWEPSPFLTNWSKSSTSVVSRPRWMLMASI